MNPIHGIYALCDTSQKLNLSHFELAQKLLTGGVEILQLRMKGDKDLSRVRKVASSIKKLKKDFSFIFIVNDFVEIALEVGADGIHLGQDDLPLPQAREKVGHKVLLGYSAHSLEEATKAEQSGADYVALGAIFPTPTKGPGHPVVGMPMLKEVVGRLQVPVVAIGGIGRDNFEEVVSSGVNAVAMISALTNARNIKEEAEWFVKEFENRKSRVER